MTDVKSVAISNSLSSEIWGESKSTVVEAVVQFVGSVSPDFEKNVQYGDSMHDRRM